MDIIFLAITERSRKRIDQASQIFTDLVNNSYVSTTECCRQIMAIQRYKSITNLKDDEYFWNI